MSRGSGIWEVNVSNNKGMVMTEGMSIACQSIQETDSTAKEGNHHSTSCQLPLSVTLSCLHCLRTAVLWNRNHAWPPIVAPPVFKAVVKSMKAKLHENNARCTYVHVISADAQTSKQTNWRDKHKAVLGPAGWVLHVCPAIKIISNTGLGLPDLMDLLRLPWSAYQLIVVMQRYGVLANILLTDQW